MRRKSGALTAYLVTLKDTKRGTHVLIVAPDLVIRFANGVIWLHTLDSVKAMWFPDPSFIALLFHFAKPADEATIVASVAPAQREPVEKTIAMLKDLGALRPANGAPEEQGKATDDPPGALVRSALAPLSEIFYRLAGTFSALSPAAVESFETKTGHRLQSRLESLIAGGASLELELKQLAEPYVEAQLRDLKIDESTRHLKLHIGAGASRLPGWVNIDNFPAELALDVTWGLPFGDGAADYVFMSHILEHLFYPEGALMLLREVNRVLAPGGRLRVIVPDVEKCLKAYVEQDETFFASRKETWHWWPEAKTRLEDFLAYAGAGPRPSSFLDSHKFGYDFETLAHVLREAGFAAVERSGYMATSDPVLRVDDASLVAGATFGDESYSLFVEATAG